MLWLIFVSLCYWLLKKLTRISLYIQKNICLHQEHRNSTVVNHSKQRGALMQTSLYLSQMKSDLHETFRITSFLVYHDDILCQICPHPSGLPKMGCLRHEYPNFLTYLYFSTNESETWWADIHNFSLVERLIVTKHWIYNLGCPVLYTVVHTLSDMSIDCSLMAGCLAQFQPLTSQHKRG